MGQMMVGYIHRPGTSPGPCETDCRHADCREQRREARSHCRICQHAIGFDRSFYRDPSGPRHAGCDPEKTP